MGFVWVYFPIAAGDNIASTQALELRTNINTDRGDVGLGAYSWTKSISSGIPIGSAEFLEMRTALDQAKDANTCSAHNATHYGTNNETHWAIDKIGHFSNDDISNNTGVQNGENGTYNNNVETGYNATNLVTDLGADLGGAG